MISIQPQEVWFARFPFEEDATQWKVRPVIVLDVNEQEAVVLSVMVSSTAPRGEYDIELFAWADVPLDHRSTARISRTIHLPMVNFVRRIGRLTDDDWENVTNLYMDYLQSVEHRFK